MKTFHLFRLFPLLLMGLCWTSCEETCPNGYYGENCEEKEYDKFISDYTGMINCGAGNQLTALSIVPEPQKPPFDVIIDMENSSSLSGFRLKAHILEDTIYIDDQELKIKQGIDSVKYTFFASRGTLTNDTTLTLQMILSTELYPDLKLSCNYNLLKN